MMKISKRNLNKIAKIYAASLLYNAAQIAGIDSTGIVLSDEEEMHISEVIQKIINKISPEFYSSFDECVKAVMGEKQ